MLRELSYLSQRLPAILFEGRNFLVLVNYTPVPIYNSLLLKKTYATHHYCSQLLAAKNNSLISLVQQQIHRCGIIRYGGHFIHLYAIQSVRGDMLSGLLQVADAGGAGVALNDGFHGFVA